METEANPSLIVSFRGHKVEIDVSETTTVGDVKALTAAASVDTPISSSDLKLLFKGKVLQDETVLMSEILPKSSSGKKVYRLMATGVSTTEAQKLEKEMQEDIRKVPRVRDDLTESGRANIERRRQLGRAMLQKASQKNKQQSGETYGFGRIETLPNLPDRDKAKEILTALANDPGVLACMAKHKWNVGALSELYPEGKVGESEVCVMGLNENKGQRIRLRIRTDDLQGFRKILSIRKVLYHELAHNVHSEHDGDFFQLMRQIEKECTEMDWTHGAGLSESDGTVSTKLYAGSTQRLGGSISNETPLRVLAAQAALSRMTKEEEEIQANCGCGRQDLFLPKSPHRDSDQESDERMDVEEH